MMSHDFTRQISRVGADACSNTFKGRHFHENCQGETTHRRNILRRVVLADTTLVPIKPHFGSTHSFFD